MAAALRRNSRITPFRSQIPSLRNPFSTVSPPPEENPSSPSFSVRRARSAIRSEPDPDRIAEIFQASSAYSRFRCDRPVFKLSVEKLARSHRHDLIERLLEHHKSAAPHNSEGFFIRIMMLYSSSGMVDHAVRTFDHMSRQLGGSLTEKSLCALLTVFLRNGKFDRLREYFDRIPAEIGVSPGVTPYNLVLRGLCEEGSVCSARSVLEKMETDKGVKPDIFSYNILLKGYLKERDEARFDEILKEIARKGLTHNVFTYNSRIEMFCWKKESFRAEELLDVMASKGIEPNHFSFNTIIGGFCEESDLESAKRVFDRMRKSASASPNADSYVMLIRLLLEKREFGPARDLCETCISKKWVPPFEAMKSLVNGLVEISKVDEAKAIAKTLKSRLRGPAVDSWAKIEGALPL